MSIKAKNIGLLNFALLIIAISAPLGNYITLPPAVTIWVRSYIGFITLGIYLLVTKKSFRFNFNDDGYTLLAASVIQGFHWITYFKALQLAGAGLGLISLFTFPLFTTFLEPIILKTKFNPKYLFLGLLVIIGLYILTPEINFENSTFSGIVYGVVSAIFLATRNILMKKQTAKYDATLLMFYQVGIISVLFAPILLFSEIKVTDAIEFTPYLLALGIISTAIGHTLYVKSFKAFSATSTSILSCIQPVYGFIMAFFFLHEVPTSETLIGSGFILGTVLLESFLGNSKSKKKKPKNNLPKNSNKIAFR